MSTLRQIAGAIKNALDCIRSVLNAMPQNVVTQDLDGHTVNFVDYSKRFSSALKGFFSDHKYVFVKSSSFGLTNVPILAKRSPTFISLAPTLLFRSIVNRCVLLNF